MTTTIDQRPIIEVGINALQEITQQVSTLLDLEPKKMDELGPPYAIISDPKIPECVEQICLLQALAYGCLFDRGNRSSESTGQKKLRLERINSFAKHGDFSNLPELRNRGVRNALAHFDERYLKMLIQHPKHSVVQDLAVTHEAAIKFESAAIKIRYYCYDIDTVFLFQDKLHPKALQREAAFVIGRLKELGLIVDRPHSSPL